VRLKTTDEAVKFFRDLLTIAEIEDFSQRFKIARLLFQGKSYSKVAKETNTSTTTVTRVAHWLHRGMGGYKLVLSRIIHK
jgi:TrpR-related protein YerC/YecD